MPKIKKILIPLLFLLLASCEETPNSRKTLAPSTPILTVVPPQTDSVPEVPVPTHLPIPIGNIRILVIDTDNQPIAGAQVNLSGDTFVPQTQTTDSNGNATFTNIRLDTSYGFNVSANGFVTTKQHINSGELSIKGDAFNILILLEKVKMSISGRVLAKDGTPLDQAVIFDGKENTLSKADGTFELLRPQAEAVTLTVSHQGFQSQSVSPAISNESLNINLSDIYLSPNIQPLRILLDGSKNPLGLSDNQGLTKLGILSQTIQQQGYQLNTITENLSSANLAKADILMMISPQDSYTLQERQAITQFVLEGHKLIISGEWGGFGGFNTQATNNLLSNFGIKIGSNTLRETNGFLNIHSLAPHPITQNINSLALYQSASVEISQISTENQILARTENTSFRIADTGAFGVLAVTLYGNGKVVTIGDSSWWLDDDSDGNGRPNIQEADNLKLAMQLISW